MQENDRVPGPFQSTSGFLAALVAICQMLTRHLLAFSTVPGTAGERWFGSFQAGMGLLLMPVGLAYADLSLPVSQQNPAGCFGFWALAVAALCYQRFRGVLKRRSGYDVHSQFIGRAILPDIFGDGNAQWKWRQDVVLIMAVTAGWGLLVNAPGVFLYGIPCALLTVIPHVFMDLRDEAKIRAARDARADAEWLAAELRKRDATRWN